VPIAGPRPLLAAVTECPYGASRKRGPTMLSAKRSWASSKRSAVSSTHGYWRPSVELPPSRAMGIEHAVAARHIGRMAEAIDSRRRSALMGRVRRKHTEPELAVRRAAHALGYRFRLHRANLPGTPDLVFPKHRIALQVHGCFWHRHQGCPRCTSPKTRADFWIAKFEANVARDRRNATELEKLGWKLAVIWECETIEPNELLAIVRRALTGIDRKLYRLRGA
jgi:DNA mismatch endonuclease (patch repair protein)